MAGKAAVTAHAQFTGRQVKLVVKYDNLTAIKLEEVSRL